MSENFRKNMNDSEQNSQNNSNSSDRLNQNNIVNEIFSNNINNNQNIGNGSSEEERKSNNSNIIHSIFNNNNIQENQDKTDIIIELQRSLIGILTEMRQSQDEGLTYQKKNVENMNEMLKIMYNQGEELKQMRQELQKVRNDQLQELKQLRNEQTQQLNNQNLLINEIKRMNETQSELLKKLLADEGKKKNPNQEKNDDK